MSNCCSMQRKGQMFGADHDMFSCNGYPHHKLKLTRQCRRSFEMCCLCDQRPKDLHGSWTKMAFKSNIIHLRCTHVIVPCPPFIPWHHKTAAAAHMKWFCHVCTVDRVAHLQGLTLCDFGAARTAFTWGLMPVYSIRAMQHPMCKKNMIQLQNA